MIISRKRQIKIANSKHIKTTVIDTLKFKQPDLVDFEPELKRLNCYNSNELIVLKISEHLATICIFA